MYSEEELKKRLFVNNYNQWADLANKKFLSNHTVKIDEVENGIILPAKYVDSPTFRGGYLMRT